MLSAVRIPHTLCEYTYPIRLLATELFLVDRLGERRGVELGRVLGDVRWGNDVGYVELAERVVGDGGY